MSFKPDPENYDKMNEPYAGTESANAALNTFRDDFHALRQKHRIANALFVAEVPCMIGDKKQLLRLPGHCGMMFREMDLLLWAMGRFNEANMELMRDAIKVARAEIESADSDDLQVFEDDTEV